MDNRSEAKLRGWSGRPMQLVLALTSACLISAHAATAGGEPASESVHRQAARHHGGSGLDDRVRALSIALDLDAKQQSELKKVIEGQREQVRKVWNESSVPAAYRVSATQAISDQTADQIRALLNEEQRKKYNPPKLPHEAADGSASPSVESWMKSAKPK